MEYCGAGSVADIMRIIEKPVESDSVCTFSVIIMYFMTVASRRGDSSDPSVCSKRIRVPSF